MTVCLRGGVELGFAAISPGEGDADTGAPALAGADECAVGGAKGRPEAVRSRRRFAGLLGRSGVGGTWQLGKGVVSPAGLASGLASGDAPSQRLLA